MEREIKDIGGFNTFIPNDNKESISKDYKFIPVHFVIDIKYNGRRKERLVDGDYLTNLDTSAIYSRVVSIEHIRLILLLADLNDVEVIAADIANVHLHGQTR